MDWVSQKPSANESPPARGRGLKYNLTNSVELACMVAPCAGAWIEMLLAVELILLVWSPPARGRGLKYTVNHDD